MPTSIGFYIGTENIDVVSVSGSFHDPKLAVYGRAKLPESSTWRNMVRVEGTTADVAEMIPPPAEVQTVLAEILGSLAARVGLASAHAHVSVASESAVVRYFQMPTIPAHERKTAVPFESRKYLPFKPEELSADYETVVRRADPSLMRVVYSAIKKTALATYTALFRSTKLIPLSLEPLPVSLMRLVRQSGQLPAGQAAAILSMERDAATISVASSDLLYLSRNVSTGAAGEGGVGETSAPDLLDAVLNETRVSIDYYRRRFSGEPPVSKVILFASLIDTKKLEEMSGVLDVPIELGDPFRKIAGGKGLPVGLATAAGAALRGLEPHVRGINLLPPDRRPGLNQLLRPLVIEAVAAALLLAGWAGACAVDLGGFERRMNNLRVQQPRLQGVQPGATVADLKEVRSRSEKERGMLQTLTKLPAKPSHLLLELSGLLPSEAWLRYAAMENILEAETPARAERRLLLQLSGAVYSGNRDLELEKINRLMAELQRNPHYQTPFAKFSLDSVQRGIYLDEEVTEFRVTCAANEEDLKNRAGSSRASGRPARR